MKTDLWIHQNDGWETLFPPAFLSEDCVYSYADYLSIKSIISYNKDNSNERVKGLKILLNSIKENDNPLIFKHSFYE